MFCVLDVEEDSMVTYVSTRTSACMVYVKTGQSVNWHRTVITYVIAKMGLLVEIATRPKIIANLLLVEMADFVAVIPQ